MCEIAMVFYRHDLLPSLFARTIKSLSGLRLNCEYFFELAIYIPNDLRKLLPARDEVKDAKV